MATMTTEAAASQETSQTLMEAAAYTEEGPPAIGDQTNSLNSVQPRTQRAAGSRRKRRRNDTPEGANKKSKTAVIELPPSPQTTQPGAAAAADAAASGPPASSAPPQRNIQVIDLTSESPEPPPPRTPRFAPPFSMFRVLGPLSFLLNRGQDQGPLFFGDMRRLPPLVDHEVVDDDSSECNDDSMDDEVEILDIKPSSSTDDDVVVVNKAEGEQKTRTLADVDCPICLDKMKNMTSTACGHVFCRHCIVSAIETKRCCPICRKRLTMKQIHPIFL